jgi:hypothetical protein
MVKDKSRFGCVGQNCFHHFFNSVAHEEMKKRNEVENSSYSAGGESMFYIRCLIHKFEVLKLIILACRITNALLIVTILVES